MLKKSVATLGSVRGRGPPALPVGGVGVADDF